VGFGDDTTELCVLYVDKVDFGVGYPTNS